MKGFCQDWRYAQANREALLSLGVYVLYFIWWYGWAYGLGGGDPAEYRYVLGLPAWFFYSCILGYPLLTVTLWIMVRCFFKDIPLDEEGEDELEAHETLSADAETDTKKTANSPTEIL